MILRADLHPSLIHADERAIAKIIGHLIDNAIKYGKPGGEVAVTIEVTPARRVSLSVRDEGEGIAPEHLPRLTERFYRADASRSRAAGGTGLGLAIVKHIVERHRGRLDISSELGKGTRVVVRIPLAEQEKPAATEAQSEEDSGPREAETQQLS